MLSSFTFQPSAQRQGLLQSPYRFQRQHPLRFAFHVLKRRRERCVGIHNNRAGILMLSADCLSAALSQPASMLLHTAEREQQQRVFANFILFLNNLFVAFTLLYTFSICDSFCKNIHFSICYSFIAPAYQQNYAYRLIIYNYSLKYAVNPNGKELNTKNRFSVRV